MKHKRLFHIIEWVVAIIAYAYLIYACVQYEDYDTLAASLSSMDLPQWLALVVAVLLMPVNQLLEAWKWYLLWNHSLPPSAPSMRFREAHRQIYYSKLAGLITPYRVGEYPARAMLMGEDAMPRALSIGAISGGTTSASIIVFGSLALLFLPSLLTKLGGNYLYLLVAILLLLIVSMVAAPRLLRRWAQLSYSAIWIAFAISSLRMLCWCLQLALILFALSSFSLSPPSVPDMQLLPLYFLLISITPNVPIVEAGVRGAWAMFLFSSVNAAMAGVFLWIINTLLPCLCWFFIRKRA